MLENRHIAIRSALGWAGLCLLLGTASCAAPQTPEQPDPLYYFLDLEGPGADAGAMDPRLQELSDAFGSGDLPLTRQLAQSLLDEPDLSPDLRSEVAAYLIESHLAQGDFAAARRVAGRIDDRLALSRTRKRESEYKREIESLQQTLERASSHAIAAQALLRLGRAHLVYGFPDKTQDCLKDLIARYPDQPSASGAVSCLAFIYAPMTLEPARLAPLEVLCESRRGTWAAQGLSNIYGDTATGCWQAGHYARAGIAWWRSAHYETDPIRRARHLLAAAAAFGDVQRYDEAHQCLDDLRRDSTLPRLPLLREADYLDAQFFYSADQWEKSIPLLERLASEDVSDAYREPVSVLLKHLHEQQSAH